MHFCVKKKYNPQVFNAARDPLCHKDYFLTKSTSIKKTAIRPFFIRSCLFADTFKVFSSLVSSLHFGDVIPDGSGLFSGPEADLTTGLQDGGR